MEILEGKHYTITQWSPTIPNYECTECQYATIELKGPKGTMEAHWAKASKHKHVWKRFPAPEVTSE